MSRARFGKFGPLADYTGADVLDSAGRLARIVGVYRCETRSVFMARLRRFDGSDAGEQALGTLELLDRPTTATERQEPYALDDPGDPWANQNSGELS